MAVEKRKAGKPLFKQENEADSQTEHDRPLKRQRKEQSSVTSAKSAVNHNNEEDGAKQPRKPLKGSILTQEERVFPRGGGAALTPLEQKQIQAQATRDVLFEDAGQRKANLGRALDIDESSTEDFKIEGLRTSKAKKERPLKNGLVESTEPRVRVSGLKYKIMEPGMVLLGQISRIRSQELVLDLPNNLSGSVPITSISAQLNMALESLTEEDDAGSMDNQLGAVKDLDLNSLFSVGQYLRAYVTSTSEESSKPDTMKSRKRIELSIDPQDVNKNLAGLKIPINCLVQASVASVEDHGIVMDLGLRGSAFRAFMSSSEIPETIQISEIKKGTVILCLVIGRSSDGNVLQLSAKNSKFADARKPRFLPDTSSVECLLPGQLVQVLVSQISNGTVAGTIMGSIIATADRFHSGACHHSPHYKSNFKLGGSIEARIIFTFPNVANRTIAVSVLDHIMSLSSHSQPGTKPGMTQPIGTHLGSVAISVAEPGLGLFVDIGENEPPGFVHISRISDTRIENLSENTGKYRSGTSHPARVLGFNSIDGIYLLSLQDSVLAQQFIRAEDVPLGEVVKAKIEKLVLDSKGRSGLVVQIAQGIGGFVREMHMADVRLQHPDRKFKSDAMVIGRVLSVDADKRQVLLTLKKSLVNTELPTWSNYDAIRPAAQSIGTISSLNNHGAIVKFYGDVQAFLPASEMSETYIKEPMNHFQLGQAITVRALTVDPLQKRMTVSCRSPVNIDQKQKHAFKNIKIGDIVSGTVVEKSADDINVELEGSGIKANIKMFHLSDQSNSKNVSIFKKIRPGQLLTELLVIELLEKRFSLILTNKPSLIKAARAGVLLVKFDAATINKIVDGFVSGIIENGVFVKFAGGLTGFLPKVHMTDEMRLLPNFGLSEGKSISLRISSLNQQKKQLTLSMKESQSALQDKSDHSPNSQQSDSSKIVVNAVDGTSLSIHDYQAGSFTKARITSIKRTQLNVQLAENVQGRIDASETFNDWEDIKDRKHPLKVFRVSQILPVKILGIHDSRTHRYLPVSHRGNTRSVLELSARVDKDPIVSLEQLLVGSWYTAFINNISDACIWVHLSPFCHGKVEKMEIADDVSLLNNLEKNFPIGSAIRVRVMNLDLNNRRLTLSARLSAPNDPLTVDTLTGDMIVPGRVSRVADHFILVQLSDTLTGQIGLTELADDYEEAKTAAYTKNDVIKVCVISIDQSKNQVMLSSRPSKVLSSVLPVKDKSVHGLSQLVVGTTVRGFVKNIADVGLFVTLGVNVTGFVRVSEMSDTFMKDWKANYEAGQLVEGKVILINQASNQVQLSLKPSVVDENYTPPITFHDLEVGQTVTGKIRKVESFGVFIVVDNSHNVSGLCHRSEIAEEKIEDVRTVYSEGDVVKARILKLEPETRRVSFGLKASYFKDFIDPDGDSSDGDSVNGVEISAKTDKRQVQHLPDKEVQEDVFVRMIERDDTGDLSDGGSSTGQQINSTFGAVKRKAGLTPGRFDWNGGLGELEPTTSSESEGEHNMPKRKRRKAIIVTDQTGDLDKFGPKSADDFERLLLGQPNSSELWLRYMAFQLELGDVEKARQLADRALKRINITEQEEKLNVWTAYLNLETLYGDDDSLEDVFKRAKEVNDAQDIHERLASIYIGTQKLDKAEELFQTMIRNKAFTPDAKLWENYATFLFDTLSKPEEARDLLDRAMKSVPPFAHRDLITRFAQLEFRCLNGNAERGRTIFEGLLDTYPKRWDLWDIFIDMEKQQGASENVRQLFERMTSMPMKRKRARGVFDRWLVFEETNGEENQRRVEHVKMKESAYHAKLQSSDD